MSYFLTYSFYAERDGYAIYCPDCTYEGDINTGWIMITKIFNDIDTGENYTMQIGSRE